MPIHLPFVNMALTLYKKEMDVFEGLNWSGDYRTVYDCRNRKRREGRIAAGYVK